MTGIVVEAEGGGARTPAECISLICELTYERE